MRLLSFGSGAPTRGGAGPRDYPGAAGIAPRNLARLCAASIRAPAAPVAACRATPAHNAANPARHVMPEPFSPLDVVETRVLGVLVEKQHTVPDTYPMSLHALVAGCNQKSSRDPVMELGEPEVIDAIDRLKFRTLVIESSGGRVARYAHNLPRVLQVPGAAVALLAVLMLRGPQTPGEIRVNAERLHRFADVSTVEAYLDELAARDPPLVCALPRAPGAREVRWAQLLAGPVSSAAGVAAPPPADSAVDRIAALEARVLALEVAFRESRAASEDQEPGRD
jgi:hypothetical protein